MGPGWVNALLLRILCHEAAHLYYDLRDDTPELAAKIEECLSEIGT